jgi:hypothetical protein
MSTFKEFTESLYDFHREQCFTGVKPLCKGLGTFFMKELNNIDDIAFSHFDMPLQKSGGDKKKEIKKKMRQFISQVKNIIGDGKCDFSKVSDLYDLLFDKNDKCLYRGCIRTIQPKQNFYRIRAVDKTYVMYNRKDLFAIPDNKQELVGQYRFNKAGHSCLYLASNLYISWEECRRPDFERLNFSRYENVKELKVLDLTINPNPKEIGHFVMAFLSLLCSVKADDNAKFKFQYVIPGIMMDLLNHYQGTSEGMKNPISGIQYMSSRRYDCEDFCFTGKSLSTAYVFSLPEENALKDLFRMTIPRSYFFYKIHRFNFGVRNARISEYQNSLFYQIEEQLKREKADKIDNIIK